MLSQNLIIVILTVLDVRAERYIIPLFGLNNTGDPDNTELTLIITADREEDLTISGTASNSSIRTQTVAVNSYYKKTYSLSGLPFLNSTRIKKDSLLVESTANLTLQVLTKYAGYIEGFMAIPVSNLGNEYYVSTFCALGGYCQITIATVVSGTTKMYIDLPSNTDEEIIYCKGSGYWKSGRDKVLSVGYPKTVQITSPRDLTGTHIYTDKPVSVLVGTHTVQNDNYVYHYLEQLTPVEEWGTEFVFRTVGGDSYGNIVMVTALETGTVVCMSGFYTTEMANGQVIKRRVEPGALTHIKSDKPIQVILFTGIAFSSLSGNTSELVPIKPGMSLVPAVEHYHSSYKVACENADDTVPTIQLSTKVTLSYGYFNILSFEHVPYSLYDVVQIQASLPVLQTPHYLNFAAGILTCENTALMPTVQMLIQNNSCEPNVDLMMPGDGVDNDCDGETDEDYCFENRRTESLFFTTDGETEPHLEDISGFRSVKIRVKSLCNITNIELRDQNNGIVFIQMTTQAIKLYGLLNNGFNQYSRQDMSTFGLSCDGIYPFWLLQTDTQLCFDIGPAPPTNCSSQNLIVATTVPLISMRIGGTFVTVTYWIDVQRQDCANLHSTWRCGDLISDCSEYGINVCTDYPIWSQVYCAVYCDFCIPDSYGQVFVFSLPLTNDPVSYKDISVFKHNPTNATLSNVGVCLTNNSNLSTGISFTTGTLLTRGDEAILYEFINATWDTAAGSNIFIYTDDDVRVTVSYILPFASYPTLLFALEPIDTAGTEYMTSFFQNSVVCNVISHDGKAVVRKLVADSTTVIGTVDANDVIQINLNGNEATGTVFSSSRPITVFCGNIGLDYTWQQLRPTNTWGQAYAVPPIYDDNVQQVVVRVITNSDFTVVGLNGDFDVDFILTNRGDFYDQEIQKEQVYSITANKPISVGVSYRAAIDNITGSSWVILPPTLNFIDDTEIFIPNQQMAFSAVIATSVNSTLASSNNSFTTSSVTAAAAYDIITEAKVFTLGRTITSTNELLYIGSTSMFKDLTEVYKCQVPGSNSVSDDLDNDCDGLTDEEAVCYTGYGADQFDVDLDGGFGEDCETATAVAQAQSRCGTPVLWTPSLPTCILNTSSGCWMVCECQCSWVINLNTYNQMTEKQKKTYNDVITSYIIKNLTIDKDSLSSEKAKLESAEDDRQSSRSIGYLGYLSFSAFLSLFIFFDMTNLLAYISRLRAKAI